MSHTNINQTPSLSNSVNIYAFRAEDEELHLKIYVFGVKYILCSYPPLKPKPKSMS